MFAPGAFVASVGGAVVAVFDSLQVTPMLVQRLEVVLGAVVASGSRPTPPVFGLLEIALPFKHDPEAILGEEVTSLGGLA
jgi:hypothetical protein